MKFSLPQSNLQHGLATVAQVAGKNSTLPILEHVLLKVAKGSLELTGTNLEIGVRTKVNAKVDAEGEITVPVRLLFDYVNLLPSETVNVELKDNQLRVTCGKNQASFQTTPSDDFPPLPDMPKAETIEVKASAFHKAVPEVSVSTSRDTTRPELMGVLMKLEQKSLYLAATDSFRLTETMLPLDTNREVGSDVLTAVIPQKALSELARITVDDDKPVALQIARNQVSFEMDDVYLIAQTIEGNFPDYPQIVPESFNTYLTLDKSEFEKAVKTASLFCRDDFAEITFNFTSGSVVVKTENTNVGANSTEFTAEQSGPDVGIVFNYRYVLDVLSAISTPQLTLEMVDETAPARLKPMEDEKVFYLIMPIRPK